MHSKWDNYFKKHAGDTNIFTVDEDRIWRNINKEMAQPTHSIKKIIVRIAVVLAIVFSVSVVIRHELLMQQQINNLAAISEDLAEKENAYVKQVSLKWDEYRSIPSQNIDLDQQLMIELDFLDTIYHKGLKDINQHGYNERAIVIMLDTYEKRLRVIERLINEKRKLERDENKSKHIRI